MTLDISLFMIPAKSSVASSSAVPFIAVNPIPSTNASISAVITSISGGMAMPKYAGNASGACVISSILPSVSRCGKTASQVKYVKNPEKSVEPYARATVRSSILPAEAPIRPIAGATSPSIISGIENPRKLPNIPLNVENTLPAHTGISGARRMPSAMAIIILVNRFIRIFFIFGMRCFF